MLRVWVRVEEKFSVNETNILNDKIRTKGLEKMETINKQYIVDEQNKKIAVQIPIETFKKIEEVLENYALAQLMKENESEEVLGMNDARAYYNQLEKTR